MCPRLRDPASWRPLVIFASSHNLVLAFFNMPVSVLPMNPHPPQKFQRWFRVATEHPNTREGNGRHASSIHRGIWSRRKWKRKGEQASSLISHLLIGEEGEGNEVIETGTKLQETGRLSSCMGWEKHVPKELKHNNTLCSWFNWKVY